MSKARSLSNRANDILSVVDFGFVGDNSTDNTAAMNALILYATTFRVLKYVVPSGFYVFNSQPNSIPAGILFEGDGPAASVFVKNYTAATNYSGLLTWIGGSSAGGGVRNMGIITRNAPSGTGAAISLISSADTAGSPHRPGNLIFDNINVSQDTAADSWSYGIYLDGTLWVAAGSPGIRGVGIQNCTFFACNVEQIHIANGVHIFIDDTQVILAGGSACVIHITGAGTTLSNSQDIFITNVDSVGSLVLDNCQAIHISNSLFQGGCTIASNGFPDSVSNSTMGNVDFAAGPVIDYSFTVGTGNTNNFDYDGTWIPTWTNLTIVNTGGNPTYTGGYSRRGKTIHFWSQIAVPATSTTAATLNSTYFTLPCAISTAYSASQMTDSSGIAYGVGRIAEGNPGKVWPQSWSAMGHQVFINGTAFL